MEYSQRDPEVQAAQTVTSILSDAILQLCHAWVECAWLLPAYMSACMPVTQTMHASDPNHACQCDRPPHTDTCLPQLVHHDGVWDFDEPNNATDDS